MANTEGAPSSKKTPVEVDKNAELMREESLAAIREGRALPTPEFAAKEGSEMITLLTHEIQGLDEKQLDALSQNLATIKTQTSEELLKTLESPIGVSAANPIIQGILGFIIGSAISPGVGSAVGAGLGFVRGTLGEARAAVKELDQRRDPIKQRAALIEGLIEKVRTEKEA